MRRQLICPQCGKDQVRRSASLSLGERLASLFFLNPFQCQLCSHRFLACRVGRQAAPQQDRREHHRIPVHLSLAFSGGRIRGKGTVRDMSIGGCLIETDALVRVNDIFYLQLKIAEHEPLLEVAAIVRSVRGRRIGLKFLRAAREEKRLHDFIRARTGEPYNVPPPSLRPAP